MIYGTFFDITPTDITAILGHTSGLIGDAMPLIVVIIGIGLGLLILRVIINIIR